MESKSNAPGVQPEPWDWQSGFNGDFVPNWGQRDFFDKIAAGAPIGNKLIVMPTGCGKTPAAAGGYCIRRAQGVVNRLLWLVATDQQREDLSPTPDKETGARGVTIVDKIRQWFGLPCSDVVTVTGVAKEVKMHRAGRAEIFVASYQSLRNNTAFFQELLSTGDWLVVKDECHHLSIEGSWGRWLEDNVPPGVEEWNMSATPIRSDGLRLRNVPESEDGKTYDAFVLVTWSDAIEEQAIRRPVSHESIWSLEFEDRDGFSRKITTDDLKKLNLVKGGEVSGSALDAWTVKHGLRYAMSYLDKLTQLAVDELEWKRNQFPRVRHQMLVFAMSCGHAKFLAHTVFTKKRLDLTSDWIGINRSRAENKDVMDRYKEGKLDVLIQVDKAGEGFDNPPSSVLLFLNLVRSETKLLQQLGRGLRRQWDLAWEDDRCVVFADSSHPIHAVVDSLQPQDEFKDKNPPTCGGGGGDWSPLPELIDIEAILLQININDRHYKGGNYFSPDVLAAAEEFGIDPGVAQKLMERGRGGAIAETPQQDEVAASARMQDWVKKAVNSVTRRAVSQLNQDADDQARGYLAGLVKKNLHARWKVESGLGSNDMLSDDFERKYQWLKDVDDRIITTGKVPQWLTSDW